MGYSIVKLYQNTKFYPNQNYKIDSIEDFLTKLATDYTPLVFSKCQYFKPLSLEKEIKLTCSQHDIKDFHKYNYARIEIKNDDTTTDWILYYFVMKVEWIGIGAVKLTLRMDTLNTFMDSMIFSPRTMVEREHIDRWDYNGYKKETSTISVLRNIPYTNEGLNPTKYNYIMNSHKLTNKYVNTFTYFFGNYPKTSIGSPIFAQDNSQFARLHINKSDFAMIYFTNPSYMPVVVYAHTDSGDEGTSIVESEGATSGTPISHIVDVPLNSTKINKITYIPYFNIVNFKNFTYASFTEAQIMSKGLQVFNEVVETGYPNIVGFRIPFFLDIRYREKFFDYINDEVLEFDSDEEVYDIDFNHIPDDIMNVHNISMANLSTIVDNGIFNYNDYSNESSMYSSEFLQFSFFYESFEINFALEDFEYKGGLTNYPSLRSADYGYFKIRFLPSLLLDNNFAFTFDVGDNFVLNCIGISKNRTLYVSINNQVPMFNDNYVNYMRNGYNYDVKIRDISREKREFEYEKGMYKKAGQGITINPLKVARTLWDMGVDTATHEQSEAYNRMLEDLQMEKNIAELKGSRVEPLAIGGGIEKSYYVSAFSKLCYCIKAPHKDFWKTISDYFYYFGNKVRKYKVPTHNNRALFDYLKCEADFVNRNNVPSNECLSDIVERYKTGVTYIHKYLNQWTFDTDYKENVENGLLAIL